MKLSVYEALMRPRGDEAWESISRNYIYMYMYMSLWIYVGDEEERLLVYAYTSSLRLHTLVA